MKKLIFLSLFVLIAVGVFAQERQSHNQNEITLEGRTLENSSIRASRNWSTINGNFIATDIKGVEHNLQDYLDAGKFVFIDVSATWCEPCWHLHQSHILKELHNAYGPEGTDEMVVLFVEGDKNTNLSHINGTAGSGTLGDWTDGGTIPYPIIDDASILNVVSAQKYPTTVVICPSGLYKNIWADLVEDLKPASAKMQVDKIKKYFMSCPADADPDVSIVAPTMVLKNTPVNVSIAFDTPSTTKVSYAWTFQGGTPATSTTNTTNVVWPQAGNYEITVVATNGHGSTTETKIINVVNELISFTYDFESCANFELDNFPPATTYDGDGIDVYGLQGISHPNYQSKGSFIAFNPLATSPPMTSLDIAPHGGKRFGACFSAVPVGGVASTNDDWFITPKVSLGKNSQFSFWAKAYTTKYGPELFNVLISTTNNEIDSFTPISGASPVVTSEDWERFEYNLSAYDNSAVYVAIQCVSSNTFIFMIDDIELVSEPVPLLSVSPNNLIFDVSGGEKSINVNANLAWTLTSTGEDWLTVSPTSGNGNGTVKVVASDYEGGEDRTASITVLGGDGVEPKTITIIQSASPITNSLEVVGPTSMEIKGQGEEKVIQVKSNVNWSAESNADWVALMPASGSDNGEITVAVAVNDGTADRTAKITISGDGGVESKEIEIKQAFNPIVYELKVTPGSISFDAASGYKTIKVTSNVNWTAVSNVNWLILMPGKGSNNGNITVRAAVNKGAEARTAKITITGDNGVESKEIEIKQSFNPIAYELKVNPESLSFEATGGDKTLKVTSNVNWTALSSDEWLTVSPVSGSNNGNIAVTAAAYNGTEARTSKIIISGDNGVGQKIITVEQKKDETSILNEEFLQFIIYPNPVQNILNIDNAEGANITITNSVGQVLSEIKSASNSEQINTTAFESGTYFVKIVIGNKISNEKVVILK